MSARQSSRLIADVWRGLGDGLGADDIAVRFGHPAHEVRRQIAYLRERRMIRAALKLPRAQQ